MKASCRMLENRVVRNIGDMHYDYHGTTSAKATYPFDFLVDEEPASRWRYAISVDANKKGGSAELATFARI